MKFLERGGLWVAGQGILMLGVLWLSLVFPDTLKSRGLFIVGVGLLGISCVFGWLGFSALGGNLTPFPKPLPKARLIRAGIYSWVRHPLYTSVFLAAVGWTMLWQSWPALLAALGLGPFFRAKARHEERWLREHFAEYADYCRHTYRFIPWIY